MGRRDRTERHPDLVLDLVHVLFVLEGTLHVRAWHCDDVFVFELGPEDACFLPAGAPHEYRVYGAGCARALVAVAPQWS